jgi:hypothetical protein
LYVDGSSNVDSENSDETASGMSIRVGHVDLSPFHIGSESGAQHSLAELVIQAVAWRQTDLAELYPSAAGGLTGDRPGAFGDSASIAARTPRAESVASDGMLHADQLPGIGLMAAAHWHYDRALSALLASGSLDAQSNLRFAKADDQQHSARTSSAARTTRFGRSAPKLP